MLSTFVHAGALWTSRNPTTCMQMPSSLGGDLRGLKGHDVAEPRELLDEPAGLSLTVSGEEPILPELVVGDPQAPWTALPHRAGVLSWRASTWDHSGPCPSRRRSASSSCPSEGSSPSVRRSSSRSSKAATWPWPRGKRTANPDFHCA